MNQTPLSLMTSLCEIPSVYPREQGIARFIAEYLSPWGFQIEYVKTCGDRPNVIATFGEAPRYLGFYGHIDTVPPASQYDRDPFTVSVDGDIARGLGVCDMKGGVACIMLAGIDAARAGHPVKLVFGVDEENISEGAHDLVSSEKLDDIECLIVAESGQIQDYTQPISVCLGRKGRIVLDIEVAGRAAHAAEATKGENAIERAAELVSLLGTIPLASHPRLGTTTLIVQEIQGIANAFSIPERCLIRCSALTVPGDTGEVLAQKISELAQERGITISIAPKARKTPYGEAFEVDTSHPAVAGVLGDILTPLGVEPIFTPSVADENIFANRLGIPVITIGAIGGGDHTKDEWVKISSLTTLVETYNQIISLYHKR